jgi:hypothetical protein
LEVIVVATKKRMHNAAANQHITIPVNGLVIRLRSERNKKYTYILVIKSFWEETI